MKVCGKRSIDVKPGRWYYLTAPDVCAPHNETCGERKEVVAPRFHRF